MRPATRSIALALAALVAVSLLGCASSSEGEATGLVTNVEGAGPAEVDRFTLRTADGTRLTFVIRPERLGPGSFAPAHLREHLASGDAVRVTWIAEDATRVATGLYDAR